MKVLKYYIPGSLLIMLAFIIIVIPEILVALVVASVMFLGIGALYLGHMVKKSEKDNASIFNETYFKSPFHRVYHSWHNTNFPGNGRL